MTKCCPLATGKAPQTAKFTVKLMENRRTAALGVLEIEPYILLEDKSVFGNFDR